MELSEVGSGNQDREASPSLPSRPQTVDLHLQKNKNWFMNLHGTGSPNVEEVIKRNATHEQKFEQAARSLPYAIQRQLQRRRQLGQVTWSLAPARVRGAGIRETRT